MLNRGQFRSLYSNLAKLNLEYCLLFTRDFIIKGFIISGLYCTLTTSQRACEQALCVARMKKRKGEEEPASTALNVVSVSTFGYKILIG